MLWLNSSRERIKAENPGISITEISKKAGEMWRQLGKEDKEVRRREREKILAIYKASDSFTFALHVSLMENYPHTHTLQHLWHTQGHSCDERLRS